jgi:hypothetical protein
MFGVMQICNAQTNEEVSYIKDKCYEGYVFPKENIIDADWMPFFNMKERFTPTVDDIIKAENILMEQLRGINEKTLMNQGKGCPIVHKKINRYKRQYFGYINNEGEKIIWINFIWDKKEDTLKLWDKKVITVLDGCSYFWNIKVDISKGKLFDLIVNGSA